VTAGVAILVPALSRPQNVEPFMRAVRESTPEPYRVLWLLDAHDLEQHVAVSAAGGEMLTPPPGGGYAHKINAGVRATDEPLILFAADDVRPRAGWLSYALEAMRDGSQVIGLNDMIPRPQRPTHATHFLVTRRAATLPCLDGGRGPLCEVYGHWRVDDELIATARKRRMYAYAPKAVVEHVGHPMIGGADDETYLKGRSTARLDGKQFARRAHLWT
jgi:hypothetical protein